jgi:hypothetical protein
VAVAAEPVVVAAAASPPPSARAPAPAEQLCLPADAVSFAYGAARPAAPAASSGGGGAKKGKRASSQQLHSPHDAALLGGADARSPGAPGAMMPWDAAVQQRLQQRHALDVSGGGNMAASDLAADVALALDAIEANRNSSRGAAGEPARASPRAGAAESWHDPAPARAGSPAGPDAAAAAAAAARRVPPPGATPGAALAAAKRPAHSKRPAAQPPATGGVVAALASPPGAAALLRPGAHGGSPGGSPGV